MNFAELQHLARKVSNGKATFTVTWDDDGCYRITMDQKMIAVERIFGEADYAALFLETHGNATSDKFPGAIILPTDNSTLIAPPQDMNSETRKKWLSNFGHAWKYPTQISPLTHPFHKVFCQRPSNMGKKAFFSILNTAALLATVATRGGCDKNQLRYIMERCNDNWTSSKK